LPLAVRGGSVLRLALVAAFLMTSSAAARGAPVVDPALRFQTLATTHFIICFHRGEEESARRLAVIAEDTWRALREPFDVQPPEHTYVLLVDQSELANGSAYPLPYNTIVVTAAWPSGSDFIGLTDDWLRLVFTHEFTHIVHLDRSVGWADAVRHVFGRVPLAFPNVFLPLWQIEGLAVYEESALTGEGRLHAGDFRAVEMEARRAGALEPLDRVNGGLVDWPVGLAAYAYGAAFQEYLVNRYGADKIAALAEITARRVPYLSSGAFKEVYGRSLGDLWRDYEAEPAEAAPTPPEAATVTRLTHRGFIVSGPRFAPPRCSGCASEIVYSVQTPHGFPSLNAVGLDGAKDRRLTTRYLGSTAGVSRDTIVFDEQEIRRNVGLYSDLRAYDRRTGTVRALTREARLLDPDLSPDGTRIVCAKSTLGRRDLVVLQLKDLTSRTIVSGPDTEFDAPRWSPDGRLIAAARHKLGSESELVLVDPETAAITVLASDSAARIVTPTWRPDGGAVVAAADFGGGVFNLYEFDLQQKQPPRQLTYTTGGATWPDVSSDGRTLVFVGYTTSGFDIFSMTYDPRANLTDGSMPSLRAGASATSAAADSGSAASLTATAATYMPWSTLAPTSWTPIVDSQPDQLRAGASFAGRDLLGYHSYALSATWLVDGPRGATTPSGAAPDWQAAYAYSRWRPVLFATAGRQTSFFAGPSTAAGAPADSTLRQHQIEGGLELPFLHTRSSHVLFGSLFRSADEYALTAGAATYHRTGLRGGWETTTAHVYGYSISPEGGVTVGGTIESVRRSLGSAGDGVTVTADARAYIPGFASHQVLALRGAAGRSTGDDVASRTFLLGGAGPAGGPLSFDSRAMSLLRGFPADTFAGSRVAIVNADYRVPLWWPGRGHGTWPIFVQSLQAAAFADAGNAWSTAFHTSDIKTAFGAELSSNLVAGYTLPFTATVGVGIGHDGAGRVADERTWYVRIGRAF